MHVHWHRALLAQLIRYVAATQATAAVVFHGGWMTLALATWGHAAGDGSTTETVTRALTRAFVWLGGVDADGRGGIDSLMRAWGVLTVGVYAADALCRTLFGQWPRIALWKFAAASFAIAAGGWTLALWPAEAGKSPASDIALLVGVFSTLAGASTAWAIAARRLGDRLVDAISPANARPPAAPPSTAPPPIAP